MDILKKTIHKPQGGLGRWPFHDPRDGKHLMRSVLAMDSRGIVVPAFKVWKHGDILDQGEEGACVGFGWTAWENCAPIGQAIQQGNQFAFNWYYRAKEVDPWPGTDYEGTTVRAGARVAIEKGTMNSYLWAGSREEIDNWLLLKGPIVIGSNWYRSMDDVDSDGFMRVDPGSGNRGGHCYLLLGIGQAGNYVFQNSWGEGYAKEGIFRMTPQNFSNLVSMGNAEFCTASQLAPAA